LNTKGGKKEETILVEKKEIFFLNFGGSERLFNYRSEKKVVFLLFRENHEPLFFVGETFA